MNKVWAIAKTEFINTLLSRGFVLAVILTPTIMGGSMLVQGYLREHASASEWRFAVVDGTGKIFPSLVRLTEQRNAQKAYRSDSRGRRQIKALYIPEKADSTEGLVERVRREELYAYIVIPADALSPEKPGSSPLTYHTGTPTNITLPGWIETALNKEIRWLRVEAAGIDFELFSELTEFRPLRRKNVHRDAEETIHLGTTFGVPAAAMFLLFTLVFINAPMLLHGVLEEKQQRIWEVLVSSVNPFHLLLGKLIGAILVSMVVAVFYLGGAALFAHQLGVGAAIPTSLYAWFIFYQFLAMLMYGSMFSAIGAACSEIRDAQSLMMPAMLLIVIPMFGWVAILRAPTSLFARGLSLFPPATPMLMLLRIALPPGPAAWEIALSIVLTSAFSLGCVWVAGRIFRVGILAQGQTPTLRRLLSWISTQ